MSETSFKITEALMKGYCDKGYTVAEIAEDITKQSGFKCTENVVRNAAKHYSIDLRKKPKKTPFVFESTEGNEEKKEFRLS